MPTINPYLTAGGLAAAVSAAGSGLQLSITHISLGAGQYTPALNGSGNATQTAMVDRREKMTLGAGSLIPPVQVTMGTVFPVYTGSAYNVGELGFWAGDPDAGGVLFAIYSAPGYVHALRNSTLELVESYSLAVAQVPAGSVTVTVDPGVANINNTMAAHLAVTDPHVAYLKKASNLSELADRPTARSNLGLGSAATQPSSAFDPAGAAVAVVPVGVILDFAGGAAPAGFLLCDGSAVSRSTYVGLFTAIGTAWGAGNGTTTFNIPDLRRKVAVGSGGTATGTLGNAAGNVGGAESHSITQPELPNIALPVLDGAGLNLNRHGATGVTNDEAAQLFGTNAGSSNVDAEVSLGGSGTAISLMQPSAVVTKIIRF